MQSEVQRRAYKREWARNWRLANPEKSRANGRIFRERHRDKLRLRNKLRMRAVYQRDPDRARAEKRKWYRANLEKVRMLARLSYTKHKQKRKLSDWVRYHLDPKRREESHRFSREGYQRNKARRDLMAALWRKNNPDRFRTIQRRRRTKKYAAAGSFSHAQWMARVEYFSWRCWMCGIPLNEKTLTQDHFIPLSKSGTNWPANLRPACRKCNAKKFNKSLSTKAEAKVSLKEGIRRAVANLMDEMVTV